MFRAVRIEKQKIGIGMEEIRCVLTEAKVSRSNITRNLLAIEDLLVKMFEKGKEETITVRIRGFADSVTLRMKSPGESFSLEELRDYYGIPEEETELRAVVDRYMSRILGNDISISNRHGVNNCRIVIAKSRYSTLIKTFGALLLGLLIGEVMKVGLPGEICAWIADNLFSSVSTMFMNALKLIVGPLVLFSLAASMADFSDLAALGKIAMKILCGYLLTSLFAVGIGYSVYQCFPVGDPSLSAMVSEQGADTIARGKDVSISLTGTITNIIPTDIISPFLQTDMLQILFLGSILGIAAAKVSDRYPEAKRAILCLNDMLTGITAAIIRFMPLAIFCSMASMMIGMDFQSFAKIIVWIPVICVGLLCMIAVYMVLLFLFTKLNPLRFLRSFFPVMLMAFSLASSNATMPYTIECCDKKLGVSKKLYSFSIPLGATINMDGSCVSMMISCLFMAKIFGVTVTAPMVLSLMISILAFSIGAPGVPGSSLVGLAIIFPQIGVPAEAISIIMGVYSLVSMVQTVVNVTGDAVITTIVANSEHLLDRHLFSQKNG